MAPEADKDALPNEQAINSWFKEVETLDVTPYDDKVSELPLLELEPQAGSVATSKTIEEIQSTELTLSNGVKVVLKPTNFKNDQILINAFSPGGTSLYS